MALCLLHRKLLVLYCKLCGLLTQTSIFSTSYRLWLNRRKAFYKHCSSDFVTNSCGESWDSSCEKSWAPVQNHWVPVQKTTSPKLKMLGPLCNQTDVVVVLLCLLVALVFAIKISRNTYWFKVFTLILHNHDCMIHQTPLHLLYEICSRKIDLYCLLDLSRQRSDWW